MESTITEAPTTSTATTAIPAPMEDAPTEMPSDVSRLALYLVKPSRYDDDGYVMRHWRGVIPSNTLSTLNGLTRDVAETGRLGDLDVKIHMVDEAVHRIPWRRIRRDARRRGTRTVVCLSGVQSNQYPRAQDLARRLREMDITVLIGGFHVSGANSLVPGMAPELQEMMDIGVTLVRGEVEACWGDLLAHAVHDDLPLMVDLVKDRPDLGDRPLPVVHSAYLKRFALPETGTIDAGRGCPFACSFCTIINVQGRKMRHRSPDAIMSAIRSQYKQGTRFYFFTDDNFARNPEWEGVFDGLIALREEGYNVIFMMQVDTLAWKIENFVEKAAAAGCVQVFIGLESIRDDNLKAAGKRQNKIHEFNDMMQAWHDNHIITHTGYILGFPHDTPETIREDVARLRDEVDADVASFFMLTPLPGSQDHAESVRDGVVMDDDLNQYDSFHPVVNHPNMTREEWYQAYRDSWGEFFTRDHMKRCLKRMQGHPNYWSLFNLFFWYRTASELGEHPMMSGFHRFRDRTERRSTFPREGRIRHFLRRTRENARQVRVWWKVLLEMQDVWLATRGQEAYAGAFKKTFKSVLTLRPGRALSAMMAGLHRRRVTREDLSNFWRGLRNLRRLPVNLVMGGINAVRESSLMLHFLLVLRDCRRTGSRMPMPRE